MPWRIPPGTAALLLAAFALACGGDGGPGPTPAPAGPTPTPPPSPAAPAPSPTPGEAAVTVFLTGAEFPVDLEFAPDGRLFYAELRTGRIRVVEDGRLREEPFAELTVVNLPRYSEHGLLGLALDPDFARNGYVYAFYTVPDQQGEPLKQRVVRFREVDGRGAEMTVILDDLPVGPRCYHNGGRLAFGPDGKLYISLGDGENPPAAQDTADLRGKILRINPDGSIPPDNPILGSPVWAWGLRNVFGLAFAPDGTLYATENGPQGYDELNRIVPGGNYGWPQVTGIAGDERFIDPLYSRPEFRVGPTGITFYDGDDLPELRGRLLFCRFNPPGTLIIAAVRGDRAELEETEHPCMLDVTVGPDGALYFSDTTTIYRWGR